MAKQRGISLNPKDQIKGSSLADDFDGLITDAGFELFTYPNTTNTTVALFLEIEAELADGTKTIREHYSAGNPSLVQPTEDGCCIEPVGDKDYDGLNDNTVAIYALTQIVNAGFPAADQLGTGDATVLKGHRFHFKRLDRKDAKNVTRQSLVPTKYLGAGSGKGSTAGAGNGRAVSGSGIEEKVQGVVIQVLGENPEGLTTAVLAQKVNAAMKGDDDRMAAIKLVMQQEFLKGGPFTYDGKRVSL